MGNIKHFDEAIQGSITKGSRLLALVYIPEAKPYSSVLRIGKSGPTISDLVVDKLITVSDWCFNSAFNHLNRRLRRGDAVKVEVLVLGVFKKEVADTVLSNLKKTAGVEESFQLPWIEETAKLLPYGAFSFTMRVKIREKAHNAPRRIDSDDVIVYEIFHVRPTPSEYSKRSDAESTITSIRMSEYLAGVNQGDEIQSYIATASELNSKLLSD